MKLAFLVSLVTVFALIKPVYLLKASYTRVSFSRLWSSVPPKKGIGFEYDPSDFRDSNSGNYRRLTDQLAAQKAEEEKLQKEKEEMLRKEKMQEMIRQRQNDTFWNTPNDKIVATADKYFVSPEALQVIADLDKQLIGLKSVKERMRRLCSVGLLHKIRTEVGLKTEIPPLHQVFTGNPGTGKTTVAMKLGELYKAMGFVNTGHTVIATRADLVGQYIGHTGPKTLETITKSFGGILFIDEAYGLYKDDDRDYGSEVIGTLIKFMDNMHPSEFVCVMAGYKQPMRKMFDKNPRLLTRIENWLDFPDYNGEELIEIAALFAATYGFTVFPEESKKKFVEFMNLRKEFPYWSNARTVRNAMDRVRRVASLRVTETVLNKKAEDIVLDDLQTILPQDFEQMMEEIKYLPRDSALP